MEQEVFDGLGKAAENTREATALTALLVRQRKKNKNVEPTLEALNKLGSRRPERHRFTVGIDRESNKIRVYINNPDAQLPKALHYAADEIHCRTTKERLK